MYNAAEELAELSKANVAQVGKVASLVIDNAEKLAQMNMRATKAAVAEGIEGAQAVAAVKEMQDLFALRARFTESGVQAAMTYSKDLYDLATEAHAQCAVLAEECWASYTKGLAGWVDKASRAAPAGSDVAVNAFKSTFAASTAAIDQISKATKEVVNFADASVRAAAASATNASSTSKDRKAA